MESTRRNFLKASGAGIAALGLAGNNMAYAAKREYNISLAGWSLHRTIGLRGKGKTPMLDMPKIAKNEFGIEAIELVNTMLASTDQAYLDQLKKNATDNGVKILLIMVDGEGNIGGETEEARQDAITRHSKWIDNAAFFGCHSIRMNWAGAPQNVLKQPDQLTAFIARSAPAFQKLCEYGDSKNINVIIENHGGPSSYPEPMEALIKAVGSKRFGTLPDFGNFPPDVDNYDAVDRMMPYAKAVSAKCYDFDDKTGEETKLNYERLIANVVDKHGYHGYIGIEFEGNRLSEYDGIKACKKLLDKLKA